MFQHSLNFILNDNPSSLNLTPENHPQEVIPCKKELIVFLHSPMKNGGSHWDDQQKDVKVTFLPIERSEESSDIIFLSDSV